MKKTQSRREFLRTSVFAASLVILPDGISRLLGNNLQKRITEISLDSTSWFTCGGETIYHLKAGKTRSDIPRSIFAAAFSGKILCYDFSGNKLWEQKCSSFFPFSMDVADIDGDGFDECVIASADGSLYIIDNDGSLIAKLFSGKTPLYAVKVVSDSLGNQAIYCGGPERILYKVSPRGVVLNQITTTYAITTINSGIFTLTSGKGLVVGLQANYAKNYLIFYNLSTFTIVGNPINTRETYQYTVAVSDMDSDNSDRIAFGGNKEGSVFDASGTKLLTLEEKTTGRGQDTYALQMLESIPAASGTGRQLIGLTANSLRFYDAAGQIQKDVSFDIAPAGLFYDDVTETLLLGSDISGGDTIYCVRLKETGWENALKSIGYKGKLATIVANINTLNEQVNNFTAPVYQPVENTEQTYVFTYNPYNPGTLNEIDINYSLKPILNVYSNEFKYSHIHFSGNQWLSESSESFNRSALPYGWDTKRDTRMPYKLTSTQIIDYARTLEQNGLSFTWTIGHGNDPFFLSLTTVEGILIAAPTKCDGFIFPEMEAGDTPAFHYAIENHIIPICNLCVKYGNRKVILRSKFLFWAADIYTDLWSWALKDKKYKDVIVPAMEETYERLCDLSISGRVGLKQGGWFNDWAGRAVHDNPLYDRQHQWSATTIGSHFLRAMVYQSEMGARINLIQLSEVTPTGFRGHSLIVKPFTHMLGKGILRCPQNTSDMLSLSPVVIGMKPASETFIEASHNSHKIAIYADDPKWVFSRLECFWGQAATPEHDFGYFGTGRRKQAMNFIPKNPYGMVTFHPNDGSALTQTGVEKVIVTDGESWYDENGAKQSAIAYASAIENTLKSYAEEMMIKVVGDVAWTATQLDLNHLRIVIIDSGYLDPDNREAQITIAVDVISATDILTKQAIAVNNNSFRVTVPMGILSIIDIEYNQQTSVKKPSKVQNIKIYPNPISDSINIKLSNENVDWDVEVFDMLGKLLIKEQNKIKVYTHSLEKGMYMVNVQSGGDVLSQMIIKI